MFINEYLLNERESRILVDESILVDFETEVGSEKNIHKLDSEHSIYIFMSLHFYKYNNSLSLCLYYEIRKGIRK